MKQYKCDFLSDIRAHRSFEIRDMLASEELLRGGEGREEGREEGRGEGGREEKREKRKKRRQFLSTKS